MPQNMAYRLEFDKGFQLLIQIHTVNKIEKQQWGPFTVTFFSLNAHFWRKRLGKKIKCNDAELGFN